MTRVLLGGASLRAGWPGGEPLTLRQLTAGLRSRHHEVVLAAREGGLGGAIALGSSPSDWDPLALVRYDRILRQERPDAVLGFYDYDSSLQVAAQRLHIPFIACVHIYWPFCPIGVLYIDGQGVCSEANFEKCVEHMSVSVPDAHLPLNLRALSPPMGAIAYTKFRARQRRLHDADAIIVSSRRFQTLLEAAGYSRIRTVPCGVDLDEFQGRSRTEGGDKIVFLPTASDAERKGVAQFRTAASLVKRSHPDARFIATNSPRTPEVEGTPRLSRNEVLDLYLRSYLVVVPSLWDEVMSNVVLEAMAASKPVVAYAVGGIPELLVDGETGLLVPRGDTVRLAEAINRLLDDRALARRLGLAGRARVESRFSVSRMVDSYLEVVGQVLSLRPRPVGNR